MATLTALVAFFFTQPLPGAQIPPAPANNANELTQDYADILTPDHAANITELQQQAINQHNTPIVVVTIHRMATYGYQGDDIQPFAQQWFNEWQIGSRADNKGILLLVSVGDRKARIELGADWGRDWDKHCQAIMDRQILPRFRQQQYGQGITNGVAALLAMAQGGPQAEPPSFDWGALLDWLEQNFRPLREKPNTGLLRFSLLSPAYAVLLTLTGVALLIATFTIPDDWLSIEKRPPMFFTGLAFFLAGLATWVVLAILILWGMFSTDRHRSSGSWGGGGSFGGGGFSGGGGASGSW